MNPNPLTWFKKGIEKIVVTIIENGEIEIDPITRKATIKVKKKF